MSCEGCGGTAKRTQGDKREYALKEHAVTCACVVLAIACVCACMVCIYAISEQQRTIRAQQFALNAQYAQLMEYVSGAEITTVTESYEADASDGGTAVAGNENQIGGAVNGNG